MTAPRPLSYWVRAVDELLDHQYVEAAGEAGLTAQEWHLINRLRVGAVADDSLPAALPHDTGDDLDDPVRRLVDDGLLVHQGPEYRLTDEGVRRVEDVQEVAVRRVRERAVEDLGEDGYQQLVDTLERVARKLGWSPL
ncbi:hypothetical protein [Nocardioides sp. TF02-7]|uniref:hypothetical protein n=1 Tax=Nocardioides sp. TF02-7 TaxID=2917724 RepID=UPI001F054E37|nr:hypothetical protein [Nocardioides sp. TF02-7]UMG94205.1 hypothetical protein MF408_09370 [Nocardioides sp. TF02-7]